MNELKRIAIVGGGISGLTAAYKLLRNAQSQNLEVKIDLFESRELGGVFKTIEDQSIECRFECGPDSFFTKTPEVVELSKELEIDSHIIPTNSKKRKSLVAKDNQLIPLPDGFIMIAPSQIDSFLQSELMSEAGKKRAFGGVPEILPEHLLAVRGQGGAARRCAHHEHFRHPLPRAGAFRPAQLRQCFRWHLLRPDGDGVGRYPHPRHRAQAG